MENVGGSILRTRPSTNTYSKGLVGKKKVLTKEVGKTNPTQSLYRRYAKTALKVGACVAGVIACYYALDFYLSSNTIINKQQTNDSAIKPTMQNQRVFLKTDSNTENVEHVSSKKETLKSHLLEKTNAEFTNCEQELPELTCESNASKPSPQTALAVYSSTKSCSVGSQPFSSAVQLARTSTIDEDKRVAKQTDISSITDSKDAENISSPISRTKEESKKQAHLPTGNTQKEQANTYSENFQSNGSEKTEDLAQTLLSGLCAIGVGMVALTSKSLNRINSNF